MIPNFEAKRVLLLQGPMSFFFAHLAQELREQGVERVYKVNFNAGDALFNRGPDAHAFRGSLQQWPKHLARLLEQWAIDAVIVFGDGRPPHRVAARLCNDRGIDFYVLEEGYLRPGLITLERGGVNGHSSMPRDPAFFLREAADLPRLPSAEPAPHAFGYAGWCSTAYSLAMTLGKLAYPRYRHHRPLNAFVEAYRWVLGGARKLFYASETERWLPKLTGEWSGRYFLVALQVYCDYQLKHSPFDEIEDFIAHVVRSFAQHAPGDHRLVFKHHPLDRPYRDYTRLLQRLAREHGLEDRLLYVHDVHLPTMLKHARGAVMINSTVGLSSIHHGTPVKVLGDAVYDMEGMTAQVPLEAFWHEPGSVDADVYYAFRRWLLHHNQANGSFYRRLPGTDNPTGVRWHPMLGLRATEGASARSSKSAVGDR